MAYTYDELFEQSVEDSFSANVDGDGYQARIAYGTKITKDNITGEVELFNTTKTYYDILLPISDKYIFLTKGWKYACYVVYLSNNRAKLEGIEKRMRKEVNSTNNHAILKSLRKRRDNILERYNKINQLLNSIT